MPQSLTFNLVHLIWSTKGRRPTIQLDVRPALYAYLAITARDLGCVCFRAGGVAHHVHLALNLGVTKSPARVVNELKSNSSAWMKTQGVPDFAWQRGYCLFSVSPANTGDLIRYIDARDEHHQKRDFQAELRAMLEKYHVPYDERYCWS